jgi:nucleotidyltransferase substrate binding protein (TIGR01987 family)
MSNPDIRWKQRFSNYKKALAKLSEVVENHSLAGLTDLEKEGLVQRFEYTYELAWLTIKDFYEEQGEINIQGSKNAFRLAYSRGLIRNEEVWLDMIESRKLTVHTYDEDTANAVVEKVTQHYITLFRHLQTALEKEAAE